MRRQFVSRHSSWCYVFNKILIIFCTKLACFSSWTQCSSAHTSKARQGEQRNYKAHSGLQKWVFSHILHAHWRAAFWCSVSSWSDGEAATEQLFACTRESSRQHSGAAGPEHLQSKTTVSQEPPLPGIETHCCFCYSLRVLEGSALPGSPGETPAQLWLHRTCRSAILLFPTPALLLLPPFWDGLWPLFFMAALQIPQHLCLAPYICTKELKVRVWNVCMNSGSILQVCVGCR